MFLTEEQEVVGEDRDVAAELILGKPLPREGRNASGVGVRKVVGWLHCLEVLIGVESCAEEESSGNADKKEEQEWWW